MAPLKKTTRIRGTTREMEYAAKRLRREMTTAERKLWQELRRKKLLNFKFRAQHPVGRFILDFYCPEKKLAVEIDGKIHSRQKERDEERDRMLALYGYRILRFSNEDVMNNLSAVLRRIRDELEKD